MRSLYFADTHLRHRHVQTVMSWEQYDRVIFGGDAFDQYGETLDQVQDAAVWLKESLHNPKHVHMFGNHDWSWMWPANSHAWKAPQNTDVKMKLIRAVLSQDDFERIQLYHAEQGILFSHAGIDAYLPQFLASKGYVYPASGSLEDVTAWLDEIWPQIKQLYSVGGLHPLMEAGTCRGGDQRVGGIIWRDFQSHGPVPGLAQICGHSIQDDCPLFRLINGKDGGPPMWRKAKVGINPRWLAPGGWTLCMDTCNHHYAIIEDGLLTIKSVLWIKPKTVGQPYTVEPGKTLLSVRYLPAPTTP